MLMTIHFALVIIFNRLITHLNDKLGINDASFL